MAAERVNVNLQQQLEALCTVGRVGDLSDGQLVRRALDGDEGAALTAFTSLVERHGPMVLRVCRHSLGRSHELQRRNPCGGRSSLRSRRATNCTGCSAAWSPRQWVFPGHRLS